MPSREKGRCTTSFALFPLRNLLIPLRRSFPQPPPFHLFAPIFNFELSSPTRTSLRGGIPAGGVSACIKGQLLFFLPRGWLFPEFLRWGRLFRLDISDIVSRVRHGIAKTCRRSEKINLRDMLRIFKIKNTLITF